MLPIRSIADYRLGYQLLGLMTEALTTNSFKNAHKARVKIVELKRELRRWAHQNTDFDHRI